MSVADEAAPQGSDEGQGAHTSMPIAERPPALVPAPISPMAGDEARPPPAADLSLRARGFPVSLEKWYLDVLLADGTVCLVYVGTLALCGRRLNRVTAELFRPGATTVRGSARVSTLAGGVGFLRSTAASIEGERVRFATDELSGDLIYRPRFAPWRPHEPFLSAGMRTLTWSVEIPDADVEGRLSWPGGSMDVRGRGYRDRVWFDLLPWRFPISRLAWGRAAAGAHVAVWTRATTARGVVSAAWVDGRAVNAGPDGAPPAIVCLGPPRVILDSDVADLAGLRLGPLRRPLAWLSGAPHETKWQAPSAIAADRGVAIHEVVTWHGAVL